MAEKRIFCDSYRNDGQIKHCGALKESAHRVDYAHVFWRCETVATLRYVDRSSAMVARNSCSPPWLSVVLGVVVVGVDG